MKRKTLMKKKLLSLLFLCSMLIGIIAFALPVGASTDGMVLIEESNVPLKLWYNEEAIKSGENSPAASTTGQNEDIGWAQWSLPIGNGYFGANVFGRTETERIQITEKTLMHPTSVKDSAGVYHNVGGLNSFSETYIDFNHTNSAITDYVRYLDMKTAISGVEYTYGGVKYTREYFTSYPDKALVIRLDADKSGALSFTLRPTIPYEQSYGAFAGDGVTKAGTVTSKVTNGVGEIELAGNMGYYGIDFLGIYKVYTDGGTVTASTTQHSYKDKDGTTKTDTDGTIVVNGAKSAYIVVTLGSDYELSSEIFTSADTGKPTKQTTIEDTRKKIGGYMNAIEAKLSGKSFEEAYKVLRDLHVADHSELFGRVSIDLGYKESDLALTTDELLTRYKSGTASTYLETLIFQFGRYLLVASSRTGALPANLQGAWNTYNTPPWAAAYTHNINVEMNYWPAFSTNLAETFQSYVDYNAAYMAQAEKYANDIVNKNNPSVSGKDGGNGWVLGNHIYPYRYTSHESAGNLGFMTQVFWEYYEYTKDPVVLEQVYSVLIGAAKYITKCVQQDADGNYLVENCDSPEVHVNGVWYYTDGTTYAQTFAYLNNYHALLAAEELGIDLTDSALLSTEEYSILKTILTQIDKYDPIKVGLSGQIKEFREETYYSSIGDDPKHRHVSQLMALYPGNIINDSTPAWLDAAEVSLSNRGLGSMGWARAHRMALWARLKNGGEAYNMLGYIIKDRTGYNLLNQGPPYQIDGSFGATAAISEMLLQSHNGYIEPLAALPLGWSTGSYTGLVARGNFEVSAVWESGLAKTFNVKSNAGGTASVYYPSITDAFVVDSEGNKVNYTVSGQDLISFETEIGKTYIIYGFKKLNTPNAPTNFSCTEGTLGALNFTWNASSGASSYNVYAAVEDAATYTLIGSTASTSFSYTPSESVEGLRTTYAVTAVGERESDRALVYTAETIATEYGEIPSSSAADATFAIFAKKSGSNTYKFIETGSQLIDEGIDKARQYLKSGSGSYQGGTVVVYLLTDYTSKGTSKGAGWNAAFQINGTLIVDLGGNKLTSTAPRLVGLEAKDNGLGYNSTTNIEFKNGTLCTSKPIVELFGGSGQYTGNKVCNVTFSGITFTPNGTISEFTMLKARGSFSSTQKATFNVTFDTCNLNYASLSKLTVIDDSCASGSVKTTLNVKGGNVYAQSFDTLKFINGLGGEDSSIFTRGSNNARTEFTVKYTSTAPTVTFNGGTLELVKVYENASSVTYRLREKTFSGFTFTPKMSLTLDEKLVINVYIPAELLVKFSLGGNDYNDLSALSEYETELDGKLYYLISTPIDAANGMDALTLVATVTKDGVNANAKFTFSIPKYALKVLDNGTDGEKMLTKDILSYIRAAYAYFEPDNTKVLADIDAIIGADYDINNPYAPEGSTATPTGFKSATFSLTSTPAIKFYLESGADENGYTFKINGRTIPYTVESDNGGKYVTLDVYAYSMCETVDCYYNGASIGSYSISAYYNWAKTQNNSALLTLVERFAKYCKTSAVYREYCISGGCFHKYTSSVKVEATALQEGVMEYKCSYCDDSYEQPIPTTLKVLAVGNSFSVDGMQHLYLVAKNAGIENVVLGTLYKGGCSLDMHKEYMSGDLASYETFYVSSDEAGGMITENKNVTAKYAIQYEDWDYIVLQQVSNYTGMASKYGNLQYVIDYVNANKTSDAKLLWHMTWAYQQDTTNSGFNNYGKDQMTMYNSIVSVVNDLILTNSAISGVIPAGTAIQNLRTSPLGDTLTRDGYHLSYGIGRYTAALTWLAAITGYDVSDITAIPSAYPEIALELDYIKQSVKDAISNPYSVTELGKSVT